MAGQINIYNILCLHGQDTFRKDSEKHCSLDRARHIRRMQAAALTAIRSGVSGSDSCSQSPTDTVVECCAA